MPADPLSSVVEQQDIDPDELNRERYDGTELRPREIFWREHQKWLEENGYKLRPRFMPDWVASFKGKDRNYWNYEDGLQARSAYILDATRISDGETVILKKIDNTIHPYEVQIGQLFSTEPLASHPRNHCVPVYDVLRVPDEENLSIIVIPLLRRYDSPDFKSVGEAVGFFRQVFEGLQFMHQCHVAHRDCMNLNILMDPKPIYPDMFHPASPLSSPDLNGLAKHYTRTARPTNYYLIDFGLSRKFEPEDGPPRAVPIWGGDKTVPEFQTSDDACDPFPTDIYYLGNMIREDFLQTMRGVEFMQPLVNDMVQDDPSKRPTIDQVVERFDRIFKSLSWWTLRSRLVYSNEDSTTRILRSVHHFFRTAGYIVTFRSAIPTP